MRLDPAIPLLALLLVVPTHEAAAVPDLVRTLPNKVTVVVDRSLGRAKGLSRTILADADRASVNAVRARLHEGNPLSAPLAVSEHEFSVVTPTLIQRFYRDRYVAENLVVLVVGDVDPEDVVQKVGTAFASMPRGKASSRSRFSDKGFQGPRGAVERNPL